MNSKVNIELVAKVGDHQLIDNLFSSYQDITNEYLTQDPVGLLQNVGLFVESILRVAEHLVLGNHTPLNKELKVNNVLSELEKSPGPDSLRIHLPRFCRAVYDLRTRKKSVHLKAIEPELIDAQLAYETCTWVLIQILSEAGLQDAESSILLLFSRKVPLVQSVDGILRTTNTSLSGPNRILVLLYSAINGLTEDELLSGTKSKIKDVNHLKTNLRNLDRADKVHQKRDGRWVLFGKGRVQAEGIISRFAPN